MKPRSHILMYEPQFAALVRSRVKLCTIRARRLAQPRPGDTLVHREWVGTPYRPGSTQRTICEDVCFSVLPIEINAQAREVRVGPEKELLEIRKTWALARLDGFDDHAAFFAYFANRKGLPFHGLLIGWAK